MNPFSNHTLLQSWRAESDNTCIYSNLFPSKGVDRVVSRRPRSGCSSGSC